MYTSLATAVPFLTLGRQKNGSSARAEPRWRPWDMRETHVSAGALLSFFVSFRAFEPSVGQRKASSFDDDVAGFWFWDYFFYVLFRLVVRLAVVVQCGGGIRGRASNLSFATSPGISLSPRAPCLFPFPRLRARARAPLRSKRISAYAISERLGNASSSVIQEGATICIGNLVKGNHAWIVLRFLDAASFQREIFGEGSEKLSSLLPHYLACPTDSDALALT